MPRPSAAVRQALDGKVYITPTHLAVTCCHISVAAVFEYRDEDVSKSDARHRVLLVDDCAPLLTALTRLIGIPYAVIGAVRTGTQALECARRLQSDFIVTDVSLPDIHGLEVCRRVTASPVLARVVMLTAADDPDVKQRALSLGASGFVLKYRVSDDLLNAIETALATRFRGR